MRFAAIALSLAGLSVMLAEDAGLRPRPSSADYPVSRPAGNMTIGAILAPPDQVKKILPAQIAKKYMVVEVAVYPETGSAADVRSLDFALQFSSGESSYPSTPQDVAAQWQERQPPGLGHGVDVTTETGVTYSSGNDPVNGRTRGWSTYEGVAVTNGNQGGGPQPPPYDPNVVRARAQSSALPEGEVREAVAGYLYFRLPAKKGKSRAIELRYTRDGSTVTLPLPVR